MGLNDFFKQSEDIEKGWMLASLTDEYIVDSWPSKGSHSISEDKLLEVRIFDDNCEHMLFRPDIGSSFSSRTINDGEDDRDHYDEIQYLDIDTKKGIDTDGKVTTTGGGKFTAPVNNTDDARVRIRYYLGKYEETGQARVEDWRVVEFLEG